ncbi:hypothetical protein LARI1_G002597 [Lachnellula arida]|uniref:Rhodopsin domain-containing protein n=1 Tax=Lachnellula arida TaxID=1316785 RepID=A0A8T9BK48_9HELO|nr:hypothetical protein LARI1_G002597 [Lachnellula arida]
MSNNSTTTTPPSPDLANQYLGYETLGTAVAFIPILTAAVGLRMYCRHLSRSGWEADDYLVLLSYICQIGASIIGICGVKLAGAGHQLAALSPETITAFFKWLLVSTFWYFLTTGIPKLAILSFYLPVVSLNLCHPFAFNWDRTIPGGHCVNEVVFYEWASFPNIVTDVVMLFLPMPTVWSLHAPRNMKISLTVMFLLGSLGLIASIVRFASFFNGDAVGDGSGSVQSKLQATVALAIWTMVEPDIYLLAACLITYHPLVTKIQSFTYQVMSSVASRSRVGKSGSASTAPASRKQQVTSSSGGKIGGTAVGTEGSKTSTKRPFPGRRKMGKHDIESLGNTFDMQDTVVDNRDGESVETGDEIHLVQLQKSNMYK